MQDLLIVKSVKEIIKEEDKIKIITNCSTILIYILCDNVLRIKNVFTDKQENIPDKENSYILIKTCWNDEFDHVLVNYRTKQPSHKFAFQSNETQTLISTNTLEIIIQHFPFNIQIINKHTKQILHQDYDEIGYVQDNLGRPQHNFVINQKKDHFYGFGENGGKINKLGQQININPMDAIGYNPKGNQNLYKHIPFYIKLSTENSYACGMYYNNTFPLKFDLGSEISGYRLDKGYFLSNGGNIDYFFINGPLIPDIVSRFTDLVGKSALLPISAYGYLGSTMYYTELEKNCDQEILKFVIKCQDENLPISNFHLSSGYCNEDSQRFFFIWNRQKFSNVKQFFSNMRSYGVSVSPNVKPGILLTHPFYQDLHQRYLFVGYQKSIIDKWWGGPGSLIDFTNPEARKIWKEMLQEHYIRNGAISIWNDNNEYDSLFDQKSICCFEGKTTVFAEVKCVQSLLMNHVAMEALLEENKDIRPYLITRSGCTGIQRYAQSWGGDNFTSWKSLKYNIPMILNVSLSGLANYGCDIGGFAGPAPGPELFIRWVQNGIFQPRFSIHSCNSDNTATSPFMYQSLAGEIKKLIKFRQTLLPLFYSLGQQAHEFGFPIVRPLFYEFQQDQNCYNESFTFMLGKYLLVANVLEEGQSEKKIYLPQGYNWYDFWTKKCYPGGQTIDLKVDLKSFPLFIRGGCIIPIDLEEKDSSTIKIILSCNQFQMKNNESTQEEFILYEDDGQSKQYQQGKFCKTKITTQFQKNNDLVKVDFEQIGGYNEQNGGYKSKYMQVLIEFINQEKGPFEIQFENKLLTQCLSYSDFKEQRSNCWYYDLETRTSLINCPSCHFLNQYENQKKQYSLLINSSKFDLIKIDKNKQQQVE